MGCAGSQEGAKRPQKTPKGKTPPMNKSNTINDKDDLVFSSKNFVFINDGKFRDVYKVGPELGKGAFGEVRRCHHNGSDQIRAVKIIKKEKLDKTE